MSERTVQMRLTRDERRIVAALRDIPPSPLRDLAQEVISRLVEFVREPRCAELQADGAPCDRSEADCEQCLKLRSIVESLVDALPPPAS
jgi:hypothetical protein